MTQRAIPVDLLLAAGPGALETIRAIHQRDLGRDPTDGEYIAHLIWHVTQRDGKWGAEEIQGFVRGLAEYTAHQVQITITEPPLTPDPQIYGELIKWPRRGASLYGLYGDPEWDYHTFAHQLSDAGLNMTCWWAWGGWRNWTGRIPWLKVGDRWDLTQFDERAFDDAEAMTRYFNSYGIWVLWNLIDLYPWSDRKQGLPGIPDANNGPFRRNVQGIRYGDDHVFELWPDRYLTAYITKLVLRLKGLGCGFQTGNECPESAMHDRLRIIIKGIWPEARVTVSRNSDSPGQYANMVDVHHFDAINFHGWKNMQRMDEVFHEEDTTGRPNTYRKLLADFFSVSPAKIIACSDGARNGNPDPLHAYDWPELLEALRFAAERGTALDHQSAAKMALFTNGTHDLGTVELPFLKQLARL